MDDTVFQVCLIRTTITKTKMTMLKGRIAKMGPKKASCNKHCRVKDQTAGEKNESTSSY